MEKILVTGGLGFIGSHLVRKLVEMGNELSVIDDLSSGAANVENLGSYQKDVDVKIDTVANYKTVNEMTKGVDTIFHLATQCLVKGMDDPFAMHTSNDIGTFNICMAAKDNDCKLIYTGTSEEYGTQHKFPIRESAPLRPNSLYAVTKVVGEQFVKFFHDTYNIPAVIVRPFNAFGPLQREDLDMARLMMGYNAYAGVITAFIKRWEKGEPPIIFGDGLQSRDFTYVTDTVDGLILLSRLEDCEVVNLGYGEDFSVLQLTEIMAKIWGKAYEPIHAPPRLNDIRRLLADTTLAESYGFKPKVSFQEGLERYVAWYRGREKK